MKIFSFIFFSCGSLQFRIIHCARSKCFHSHTQKSVCFNDRQAQAGGRVSGLYCPLRIYACITIYIMMRYITHGRVGSVDYYTRCCCCCCCCESDTKKKRMKNKYIRCSRQTHYTMPWLKVDLGWMKKERTEA